MIRVCGVTEKLPFISTALTGLGMTFIPNESALSIIAQINNPNLIRMNFFSVSQIYIFNLNIIPLR